MRRGNSLGAGTIQINGYGLLLCADKEGVTIGLDTNPVTVDMNRQIPGAETSGTRIAD